MRPHSRVLGHLAIPALLLLAADPARADPGAWIAGVPDVSQANSWTCGAAAVEAILTCFGWSGYQEDLVRELGTTERDGTHPERMVARIRAAGLGAELVEGMTPDDLRGHLGAGRPVIVDLQAWSTEPGVDYATAWEDGHYVIAVGFRGRRFYFEDPSLAGSIGYLDEDELLRRWHDYEEAGGVRREYRNMGIVVRGERVPRPRLEPIE